MEKVVEPPAPPLPLPIFCSFANGLLVCGRGEAGGTWLLASFCPEVV